MTALSIFLALHLAFFAVRLIYRKLCFKSLNVRLFFSQKIATEGDRLTLFTELTNAKWLPLPWIAVKFQISRRLRFADMDSGQITDDYYRNDLYNVLMYQKITRRLHFECTRRGYYRIKSLDITGWDLLMDQKQVRHYGCDIDLTVYPATIPVPEINELLTNINGHLQSKRFTNPDPFTFRGIREYTPGDPLKAVNFKASAKSQNLMVNLWDYSISRQVVLMLNLQKQSALHSEDTDEQAIKVAASLAGQLAMAHIPVRFITNNAALPEGAGARHHQQILELLAHIDLNTPHSQAFADILSSQHQQEPEYWLISAYQGEDLTTAYQRLTSQGIKTVWIIPCEEGTGHDRKAYLR